MDNLKKGKYKIFGTIFGFIFLLVLGFVFAVFPIIRGIVFNSDEIQKKIIDNEINQTGIGKISEMEKVHQLFSEKKDTFDVIVSEGSEVDFIKKIEKLAEKTENKIELKIESKDNKISNSKKDEKNKENTILGSLPYSNYILVEITLFGSYEGLINFLGKIEKFEKYISVVKIDLSKVEEIEEETNKSIFYSTVEQSEKKKKELLKSVIGLVVYVKK